MKLMTSRKVVAVASAALLLSACSPSPHPLEGDWNCASTGVGFQFLSEDGELKLGLFEDDTQFTMHAEGGAWRVTNIPDDASRGVAEWSGTYEVDANRLTLSIEDSDSYGGELPDNKFLIEGVPEDGRGPSDLVNADDTYTFVPMGDGFQIRSSENNHLDCARG